eukprot:TRINITY_DN120_c1_g3_i1.p1 TRINITY_DN120_c1_g3~~TRINITY_DN120_c1_g3_i1.p1  ORF type:complete len:363 (+),score=96.79 TRINITY_DN120_c1_g3_i1:90-1178(+)
MAAAPADDQGMGAAEDHAECPVCFDPLAKCPLSAFVDAQGKRSCRHYFHFECVTDLPQKVCPMCRSAYHSVLQVPDPLADPAAWLRIVDSDGSGFLTLQQAQEVLRATLDVDEAACDKAVAEQWPKWTGGSEGRLGPKELPGALEFMRQHLPARPKPAAPPRLGRDHASKMAWFDFWDADGTGFLDRNQVTRAFIKSLRARPAALEAQCKVRFVGGGRFQGPQRWPDGEYLNVGDMGTVQALSERTPQGVDLWIVSFPGCRAVKLHAADLEVTEGPRDRQYMAAMRSIVNMTWRLHDRDGDGKVSKQDFVANNGLADNIMSAQGMGESIARMQEEYQAIRQGGMRRLTDGFKAALGFKKSGQ